MMMMMNRSRIEVVDTAWGTWHAVNASVDGRAALPSCVSRSDVVRQVTDNVSRDCDSARDSDGYTCYSSCRCRRLVTSSRCSRDAADLEPEQRFAQHNWFHPSSFFIIARQHAMHAERDMVLAIPSVRPSVCLSVPCRYCV